MCKWLNVNINLLGLRTLATITHFFNCLSQGKPYACTRQNLYVCTCLIIRFSHHSRHNIVIVERDYYSHFKQHPDGRPEKTKSSNCSYADLILDQSVGVIIRPMSQLSTDAGLKSMMSITTALSFQFEACWILLYTLDRQQ